MNDIVSKMLLVVFTVGITQIINILIRKRKILQYDVFSMPLLRFTPKQEHTLTVSVDKSLLTGRDEDKGQLAPVVNAYGFEIEIMNVGNEDITEAGIEIRLHESAKILEYETNPASQTNYKISFERDNSAPNVLHILVPYINHRDRFLVRLVSTENTNRECVVDIRGLGVKMRRYAEWRGALRFVLSLLIPILIVVAVGAIFPNFFPSLGVTTETVQTTKEIQHTPPWLILVLVVLVAAPLLFAMLSDTRNRPRRTKEYGSGGIIKVQNWDLDEKK